MEVRFPPWRNVHPNYIMTMNTTFKACAVHLSTHRSLCKYMQAFASSSSLLLCSEYGNCQWNSICHASTEKLHEENNDAATLSLKPTLFHLSEFSPQLPSHTPPPESNKQSQQGASGHSQPPSSLIYNVSPLCFFHPWWKFNHCVLREIKVWIFGIKEHEHEKKRFQDNVRKLKTLNINSKKTRKKTA